MSVGATVQSEPRPVAVAARAIMIRLASSLLPTWTTSSQGDFAFDRVYGGWWGKVVVQDGPAAIRRSADRYIARLRRGEPG